MTVLRPAGMTAAAVKLFVAAAAVLAVLAPSTEAPEVVAAVAAMAALSAWLIARQRVVFGSDAVTWTGPLRRRRVERLNITRFEYVVPARVATVAVCTVAGRFLLPTAVVSFWPAASAQAVAAFESWRRTGILPDR